MINRYTSTVENAMSLKYAIEGVLLDEKMQSQSLRFMRYVAVWLLRVASRTDYNPEKDLQFVLPPNDI
jgi:ubiquitin conjugation factor E4 B